MQIIKVFSFLLILFILPSCSPPNEREISRISSPDGKVDVVVTEVETGATVATPTKMYLVPRGMAVKGGHPFLIADHFELKKLFWHEQNLIIYFYQGKIFQYRNRWSSQKVDNFKYEVKIFLTDSNTPQ